MAFNEAIRWRPTFGEAYYRLGLVRRKQGYEDEAKADFDKAKQLGYTGPQ
jgi:tetratricopeptide (TPR) repeat protein